MDTVIEKSVSRFKTLHPYYYLDHFKDVINLYLKMYGKGYFDDIDIFLTQLKTLNHEQTCILVRALNWKKTYFKRQDFKKFHEIKEMNKNLDELVSKGFLKRTSIHDLHKFRGGLTKQDLEQIFSDSNIKYKKSASKPALLELLVGAPKVNLVYNLDLIFVDRKEVFEQLLYSCFGTLSVDLGTYALKDLGIRQSGNFNVSNAIRFESSAELQSEFYYCKLLKDFDFISALELNDLITMFSPDHRRAILTEKAEKKFNQLILQLAKRSDLGDEDRIKVLTLGTSSPVRMKLARELYRSGDKLKSKQLTEMIIDDPADDEELLEANNFLEIKFEDKRLSSMTRLLRSAETLEVDEVFMGSVEYGVKKKLEESGLRVDRAENELWRSLFGLLFWDLLYGEHSTSIHSEFDRIPSTLIKGEFFSEHQRLIEFRVDQLFSSEIKMLLLKNYTSHYGKKNAVFRWKRNSLDKIMRLLETNSEAIKLTLTRLAKDYKNNKSGFPDLVCYEKSDYFFAEVKGVGDSVRKNQMVQLQKMNDEGHTSKIFAVNYVVDSNQTYVVVDVETTGGHSQNHRVTEIGAVKVKNGQIIDEFHTLLNPMRAIPANITRLTGITNQMVSNAPLFSDVADDFLTFCEGAIFAAHHVRFDYGFIKAEFERLGRRFRSPTFCTCTNARRFLKGPKRYGLAPLCEFYGIELKNHHRALDDAKAAAELLLLINTQRTQETVTAWS